MPTAAAGTATCPAGMQTEPQLEPATSAGVILPETRQFLVLCSLQLWQQLQRFIKLVQEYHFLIHFTSVLQKQFATNDMFLAEANSYKRALVLRNSRLLLWKTMCIIWLTGPQSNKMLLNHTKIKRWFWAVPNQIHILLSRLKVKKFEEFPVSKYKEFIFLMMLLLMIDRSTKSDCDLTGMVAACRCQMLARLFVTTTSTVWPPTWVASVTCWYSWFLIPAFVLHEKSKSLGLSKWIFISPVMTTGSENEPIFFSMILTFSLASFHGYRGGRYIQIRSSPEEKEFHWCFSLIPTVSISGLIQANFPGIDVRAVEYGDATIARLMLTDGFNKRETWWSHCMQAVVIPCHMPDLGDAQNV